MIKQLYIISLVIFLANIFSTARDWELVWSDEFDYSGVPDSTKWSFDVEGNAWDWGNDEQQNYTPASKGNAWVENGHLIIEARKEKWTYPGDGQERDFTSARLRTINKGDWCYCKVEVRAKLPGGRGTWPAIWMLPTDWAYGEWPKSGELDIMENVGFDPNQVHFTIHTEAYNHMNGTQQGANTLLDDPMNNFNIYSMEWFEDHVDFYANDDKIFTFENEGTGYTVWPFDKRFHLLLNIAIGGSWGGQQGIDTTIFPVQMVFDYVRVYQENVPIINKTNLKPGFSKPFTVTIYSLTGRKLYSFRVENSSDISKSHVPLAAGIYFKRYCIQGKKYFSRLLLKK